MKVPPHVRACLVSTAPESVQHEVAWAQLSADEQQRAATFRFPKDAGRWMRARYWLRVLLGNWLGEPPAGLNLALDARGKPRLAGAAASRHFNLSHSGDWVAIAMSEDAEVGIDIEGVVPDFPTLEVAGQYFTLTEQAALAARHGSARARLFFQLWTAKESLMKATGLGIALPPDAIDVVVGEDGPCGYASHSGFSFCQREWRSGLWTAVTVRSARFSIDWCGTGAVARQRADGAQPEIAAEFMTQVVD